MKRKGPRWDALCATAVPAFFFLGSGVWLETVNYFIAHPSTRYFVFELLLSKPVLVLVIIYQLFLGMALKGERAQIPPGA